MSEAMTGKIRALVAEQLGVDGYRHRELDREILQRQPCGGGPFGDRLLLHLDLEATVASLSLVARLGSFPIIELQPSTRIGQTQRVALDSVVSNRLEPCQELGL